MLYKLYNKQGHGTPLTLDKEYFQTALHANAHYLIFKIKVFWQKMIEKCISIPMPGIRFPSGDSVTITLAYYKNPYLVFFPQ